MNAFVFYVDWFDRVFKKQAICWFSFVFYNSKLKILGNLKPLASFQGKSTFFTIFWDFIRPMIDGENSWLIENENNRCSSSTWHVNNTDVSPAITATKTVKVNKSENRVQKLVVAGECGALGPCQLTREERPLKHKLLICIRNNY